MKHKKKPLFGSEYDIAYFVLHFIPGEREIISKLVDNESAKISAFVVVCGGVAAADDFSIVNAFFTVLFTL